MALPISLEQAQQMVLSAVSAGPTVAVPLRAAVDRTLAEPVVCDTDYPPFDRALMDGYAVRSADLTSVPVDLAVVGRIAAGSEAKTPLGSGQAMQINTGAPIPAGCNAVVPVEDTGPQEGKVTVRVAASAGQYIAKRAACVRAGQTVLEAGTRLSAGQIAICAAAGRTCVMVYRQPSVGILITGSELVEPDRTPAGGQIRDSNRYVLDALIRRAHCRPVDFGVAPDDRRVLTERIREGLTAGFLCITGGVSMGDFDYVPRCLEACGAALCFHRVALKPGRPALFATTEDGSYVFGLPGNPVGVFAAFWLLVAPALARRQGRAVCLPRPVSARLTAPSSATAERRSYRPIRVEIDDDGRLTAEPLPWQGSGDPFGMARANALLETAPGTPPRRVGDEVRVVLLEIP